MLIADSGVLRILEHCFRYCSCGQLEMSTPVLVHATAGVAFELLGHHSLPLLR